MPNDERRMNAVSRRADAAAITVLAVLLLTTGCVRRSLTIRTQPPGAMVYLNDRLMGESPATFDFLWYGWHRVMLRKDGFERLDDRRTLRCPPYLWIPFDLVLELLPLPIRDTRTWDYTLTPSATPPTPTAPADPIPDAQTALPVPARPDPAAPPTPEVPDDAR